jgi:hypothetical protein
VRPARESSSPQSRSFRSEREIFVPNRFTRLARTAVMAAGLLIIAGTAVGGIALAADRSGTPASVTPSVAPSGAHGQPAGTGSDGSNDDRGERDATAGPTAAVCGDDHGEHNGSGDPGDQAGRDAIGSASADVEHDASGPECDDD